MNKIVVILTLAVASFSSSAFAEKISCDFAGSTKVWESADLEKMNKTYIKFETKEGKEIKLINVPCMVEED